MGVMIFFVISNGQFPTGGNFNLAMDFADLVRKMMRSKPKERPTADETLEVFGKISGICTIFLNLDF